MKFKRLNKLGLLFVIVHTIIVVTVWASDVMFAYSQYGERYSEYGVPKFHNLMFVIDLPVDLLRYLILSLAKIPILGLLVLPYALFDWFHLLHFVIFGGLMYYFIGVLLSKIPNLFQRNKGKGIA